MKKTIIAIVVLLALFAAVRVVTSTFENMSRGERAGLAQDYKKVVFTISGQPFAIGDTASSSVRYFGNEVVQDLDGDGALDVAFLVTQNSGGSGTFFYLVGALKRAGGYVGTQAVFIGDRIAPQSTDKGEGRSVVVNYMERAPGAPMTAQPTVAKSLHVLLDVDTLSFGELVQGFEGDGPRL